MRLTKNKTAALLLVFPLALTACGGGPAESETSGPIHPPPTAAVPGCGAKAATDLSKIWPREIARCDRGAPAPAPLKSRTKITIAIPSQTADYAQALVWGVASGEFAKENLDVEIVALPSTDALPLVGEGKLDGYVASSFAAFFNAVDRGFDIRWVIGSGWLRPDSKQGVWARGRHVKISDLKGARFGTAVGMGSAVNVLIDQRMKEAGLSLKDMSFETVDVADSVTALRNGSVDAAMVLDPFWVPLKDDPNYTFIAPSVRPGSDSGGIYFGPSMFKRRDVGVAFARAYIRTVNTYLAGDYKADPDLIAKQSTGLGVPVDKLDDTPSYVFNWDVPKGASDEIQQFYLEIGKTVTYREVIPETKIVDRSYAAEAVGRERP